MNKNRPDEKIEDEIQRQYACIDKVREINNEKAGHEGRQPTYDVRIFGCQMNEHDAEKLTGMLEEMGYTKAAEGEQADVIVFETCCVRENAELKVFAHMGLLKPSEGV